MHTPFLEITYYQYKTFPCKKHENNVNFLFLYFSLNLLYHKSILGKGFCIMPLNTSAKKIKTVLITGASRGIGRETARQFALAGYNVAIHYNQNKDAAQTLYQELTEDASQPDMRYRLLLVQADVADRGDVREMISQIHETFGPIDILVNNAGIAQQKLFSDITDEDWNRMFDVNMKGMFHCTQEVLSDMIRQKSGKIVNVSSIWGIAGASCEVHYSAAKAAVIGFTKALAKELGPSGIQVNCVAPGVVQTEMNAHLTQEVLETLKEETPLGILGTPKHIADAILFLASEKADFITGQILSANGGIVI